MNEFNYSLLRAIHSRAQKAARLNLHKLVRRRAQLKPEVRGHVWTLETTCPSVAELERWYLAEPPP